jgi:hypothetical protein
MMTEPWRVICQLRVLAFETIRLHEEKYGEDAWRDDADLWLKEGLEQMIVIADRAEAGRGEYDAMHAALLGLAQEHPQGS